jgi:hypothetical protein
LDKAASIGGSDAARRSARTLDNFFGILAMSDDFIVVVPRDPTHVPTAEVQRRVAEVLSRLAPKAEDSTVQATEEIQFFDCGENFERISCPRCSADISIDWWHERLDDDAEGDGFQLASYELPCCGGTATLNELIYDWPQAFGRFRWEVTNPNIGALSDGDKSALEAAAGFELVFVRQHI